MKMISEFVSSEKIKNLSDYIRLNKNIEDYLIQDKLESSTTINIALLSSFTVNGIKETLRVLCAQFNVSANFYICDYNQYAQEILNPNSNLYTFKPDLVFLFIDTRSICGDLFFLPNEISFDKRKEWVKSITSELINFAEKLTRGTGAKVVLHNFEVPTFSPLGILENKQELGFIESIELINQCLRDTYKNNNQVFLFDYNAFSSHLGKNNILDYKMYYLGDIKISPKNIPSLCESYIGYIRPLVGKLKKCIILDLDNTLWGGIIGEDGIDGIDLGPTPKGRPFVEFQKFILSYYNRGIILAINSKNNHEEALNVIKNHPNMVLKEEHFVAKRINWEDKATNLISISKEINIGLESMVFIDDDQVNRELIKKFIPEVTVVDLPEDPSLYVKTFTNLVLFDNLNITSEDLIKSRMYNEEKKRQKFKNKSLNLLAYLKELKLEVTFEETNQINIPRISQLTQKTNQFNMTTRRYTVEDIITFNESSKHLVIPVSVVDKFGDYGLTGLSIIKKEKNNIWLIDTFLLSCRVLGRNIEDAIIIEIINTAKNEKVRSLKGEFISTVKNKPAQQFFKNFGFKKIKNNKNNEIWELDLSKNFSFPDFIKIN